MRFNADPSNTIVAIVDDNPYLSHVLGQWLELQDLRVSLQVSGESLMQVVRLESGRLSLHHGASQPQVLTLVGAVLDLNLPGITGIELAHTLRSLAPELPIVIITALGEDDRLRYGPLPSGVQCLKKPFDLETLEDALFPLVS